MNRSYSKIRHIQESNQILEKRLLKEQPESRFGLERFGYNPNKPETLDAAAEKQRQFNQSIDIHTLNTIIGFASAFIPVVGPFIAAGIGLMDAGIYLKQGKKTEAAIVAAFSLLPGMGKVVSKIPGISSLGKKGMSELGAKVAAKQALNATEKGVVDAIAANAPLITAELNQTAKTLAVQAAPKVAQAGEKQFFKHIAEKGLEKGAEHYSVHSVGGAHPPKSPIPKPQIANVPNRPPTQPVKTVG